MQDLQGLFLSPKAVRFTRKDPLYSADVRHNISWLFSAWMVARPSVLASSAARFLFSHEGNAEILGVRQH